VLDKYTDVFDGKLGCYPHEKINIQLKPGAKPIHKRPYPVPYKREELFKRELKHLVRKGILRECGATMNCFSAGASTKILDDTNWC